MNIDNNNINGKCFFLNYDIKPIYNLDDENKIDKHKRNYYKVQCVGLDEIQYKCSQYYEIISNFRTSKNLIYNDVLFSVVEDPTVLLCEDLQFKIFLIKLHDNKVLMIIDWPVDNPISILTLYEFLIRVNIHNLISDNKKINIKRIILPCMKQIQSLYFDTYNIIEDINDFKNLFENNNIEFETKSKFSVINSPSQNLMYVNINDLNIEENKVLANPYIYIYIYISS